MFGDNGFNLVIGRKMPCVCGLQPAIDASEFRRGRFILPFAKLLVDLKSKLSKHVLRMPSFHAVQDVLEGLTHVL